VGRGGFQILLDNRLTDGGEVVSRFLPAGLLVLIFLLEPEALVVRVLGYRSGGPGSIPGTTRKKSSGSGTGSTQPREYNLGAT
jgi:hypothetical protein